MMKSLAEMLERRAKVERRIVTALAHLPPEQQLAVVMSWVSVEALELAAETICK